MFTLNNLKKIIYSNTASPRNITFLTTFMPLALYANSDPNLNIHLTDSDYGSVSSWLSNLMNGKTKLNGNIRVSKSGVERVRKQLLSILLNDETIIYDMEMNFRAFINLSPIDLSDLVFLIQNDPEINDNTKNHLILCLHGSISHGLSLIFICALLPDHIEQITKLKAWHSIHSFCRIPRNSPLHTIILDLQENLTKLLNTIKESCGWDEEKDNCCLEQINEFDSLLKLYFLKLPKDIYSAFNNILESAKNIYYKLYKYPYDECSYPTKFVYNLEQIA